MIYGLRKLTQCNLFEFLLTRIYLTFSVTVFAILISSHFVIENNQLRASSATNINQTIGGACYTCIDQDYCTTNKPCKQIKDSTTLWAKKVGTGITQKFCGDIGELSESGGNGYTTCKTDTNKECMKAYTCTDKDCNNCGEPGIEIKSTNCDFGEKTPCNVPPSGG